MASRPPLPPFTEETARQKVQMDRRAARDHRVPAPEMGPRAWRAPLDDGRHDHGQALDAAAGLTARRDLAISRRQWTLVKFGQPWTGG